MADLIDFICAVLLFYIAIKDIRTFTIGNKILLMFFVLSVIKQLLLAADIRILLLESFAVAAVFIVPYCIIKNLIGGGDIKLIFVLGVWLGFPQIIAALYVSFISGGVFSALYLLFRRGKGSHAVPFAPFLAGGAFVSIITGGKIYDFWRIVVS